MSILFVLLMFLLVISVRYFIEPHPEAIPETEIMAKAQSPRVKREYGSKSHRIWLPSRTHVGHEGKLRRCTSRRG